MQVELLTIGEMSERTGVVPSTLRFYEAEGLIHPTRSDGGQRRYTRDTIRRVSFIRIAKEVGLSLEEIGEAMASLPDNRTPNKRDWERLSTDWAPRIAIPFLRAWFGSVLLSLEIGGLVDRPRSYAYAEIAALASVAQETTLMCISNGVGDALMSNARWTGIPLRTLLEAAGPRPGGAEALLRGADGYTDTIPLAKALDPSTLVVFEMNGEPLPRIHGYPVRLIVPGMYGEKNVKWVTAVEIVDHDVKGFYEQQGWGPDFEIPIRSRFYEPDLSEPIRLGAVVGLRGIVFGGDKGISRAEVSLDGGQSWQAADLEYPGTRLSWAIWRYHWRPEVAGEYFLAVRGFDATARHSRPRIAASCRAAGAATTALPYRWSPEVAVQPQWLSARLAGPCWALDDRAGRCAATVSRRPLRADCRPLRVPQGAPVPRRHRAYRTVALAGRPTIRRRADAGGGLRTGCVRPATGRSLSRAAGGRRRSLVAAARPCA